MRLSNFHWFGLLAVSIACGSGAGDSSPNSFLNQSVPGSPNTPPGNPNAPPGTPGGGNTTGQGGGGGDGGTGNVGQGGSGGGDCLAFCESCGAEDCAGLCASLTQEQIDCALAAPDCSSAGLCFQTGTGGTGGGGTGGGTGGCTYPDCGGCGADVCATCLCIYNGDTELCASSCG